MGLVFDSVSYDKLNNLSFEINDGKINGIVGDFGSGKSTIVSLIDGIISPSFGEIYTFEQCIGVLYEDVNDMFFYDNVRQQFVFTLKMHYIKNIDKKIYDSLKLVGLSKDILNRSFYNLSLSEQKRLSLALVLSYNPKIVVLDEPFRGLDGKTKEYFEKLLLMLKFRYKKTIIVCSSDVDDIYRLCDNVILINEGTVLKSGDKYLIFTDYDLLKKCNLCVPKLVEFSNMVKNNKGVDIGYRDDINDLIKDIYRFVR